ncbi:MAG: PspA/IM30 family protein, partial [Planctomycetes bacterium]|nr:PspA/IM30 family protein [Planctomycetota bacterium]
MGLFQRVSDIISANLNDLVEKFEDPELMLKQAIHEMETSIAEARMETARALGSEKLVKKSLADNERQVREWQQRAEKAIAVGDDVLARKALRRKQEYAKVVAALQDQATAAGEASRILRRQYEGMQAKLAEARRSLATLVARQRAAQMRKKSFDVTLDTNAFAKFDRISQRVAQAEAEADALRELAGGSPVEEAAVATSPDELNVEAELEELKK